MWMSYLTVRIGLAIAALGTLAASPEAQASSVSVTLVNGAQLTPARLLAISHEATELSAHPLLAGRVPKHWTLLIDGDLTEIPGYTSEALRGPDASPAITLSRITAQNPTETRAALAHELAHLAHYKFRPGEETWLQEGIALLMEYRILGALNRAFEAGLLEPETSLIAAFDPLSTQPEVREQRLRQYGHLQQYFIYLYRICGGNRFLERVLGAQGESTDLKGIDFLDKTLRAVSAGGAAVSGACRDFETSFHAFQRARFNPRPFGPEDSVFPGADAARARGALSLPPFSAGAYRVPGKGCAQGDEPLGLSLCLRIRWDK
jgi:hypothetical protein